MKNPRKTTINKYIYTYIHTYIHTYTVRSEILEASYRSVSWSRLFFLININYYDLIILLFNFVNKSNILEVVIRPHSTPKMEAAFFFEILLPI